MHEDSYSAHLKNIMEENEMFIMAHLKIGIYSKTRKIS